MHLQQEITCTASAALVLAGDIGGTNSRFDLYEVDIIAANHLVKGSKPPGSLILSNKYKNTQFDNFDAIVDAFLKEAGRGSPRVACLAVAGPTQNNRVEFTNR